MRPKQKKLNRLSDMRALSPSLSAGELEKLQFSRILNYRQKRPGVFLNSPRLPVFTPVLADKKNKQPLKQSVLRDDRKALHTLLAPGVPEGQSAPVILEPDVKEKLAAQIYLGPSIQERITHASGHIASFSQRLFSAAVRNIKNAAKDKRASSGTNFLNQNDQPRLFRFHLGIPRLLTAHTASGMAVFLGLCLLLLSAFPFLQLVEKNRQSAGLVLGVASGAYQNFETASTALLGSDFATANSSFSQAYAGFNSALNQLNSLSAAASLLPQTADGGRLLRAAEDATVAMQYVTLGMQGIAGARMSKDGVVAGGNEQTAAGLEKSLDDFRRAYSMLLSVEGALSGIDASSLPLDLKDKVSEAKQMLAVLTPGLERLVKIFEMLVSQVTPGEKRYLILFQNFRELRATGGFIGTYGLLTLNYGKIKELKIDSIYNPDGQIKEEIAAPGPIQKSLSKTWTMRDSNWFFDFPTSARKASEFLKLETGRDVDAVVAFNPKVFEKIINLTGPIAMPGYGVTLTAENFIDEVQRQTSEIYDKKLNQPKKFLADFAPLLLDKLSGLDTGGNMNLFDVLIQSLNQKDILLSSFNNSEQQRFDSFNWSGSVRGTSGDYLAVVNTNVGAGKTDQDTEQRIKLDTKILIDGSTVNTLTIRRVHKPGKEKDYPLNVDFLRVFVPAGSKLISASGFDDLPFFPSSSDGAKTDLDLEKLDKSTLIDATTNTLTYTESGKTVFANWIELSPGESREVRLEYKVPMNFHAADGSPQSYNLLVQKQSGQPATLFESTFQMPRNYGVVWSYPENLKIADGQAEFSSALETDKVWGVVFK